MLDRFAVRSFGQVGERAEQVVAVVEREEARAQVRRRAAMFGEAAVVLRAAVAGDAGAGHELLAAPVEVDRQQQLAVGCEGEELRERRSAVGARRRWPFHRDAGDTLLVRE